MLRPAQAEFNCRKRRLSVAVVDIEAIILGLWLDLFQWDYI
jgi:hypothetical protein